VHHGNTFHDVLDNIRSFCHPICNPGNRIYGIGLWLSNNASLDVDVPLLQETLASCNVKVFTINGFPYSDFHSTVVKHHVYEPNWCNSSRLEYTLRLANILAAITEGDEAGISTLPLGWGTDSFESEDAAAMLQTCINELADLEQRTGICIHLDIEAEPGCRLQRSVDISTFVNKHFNDDEGVRRYLRVCHDVCHASVMHETTVEAVANYKEAGLLIGKVQLSSAIEVCFDEANRNESVQALQMLAEPKYLHQTSIKKNNTIEFHENLSDVSLVNPSGLWRVHYHVPIHQQTIGPLGTTQEELEQSIPILAKSGATDWEIETYTWDVTPTILQNEKLVESVSKELAWAAKRIYT
jgi:sugar phosphate isomerase/epimerase